jgi:hypothetical protein
VRQDAYSDPNSAATKYPMVGQPVGKPGIMHEYAARAQTSILADCHLQARKTMRNIAAFAGLVLALCIGAQAQADTLPGSASPVVASVGAECQLTVASIDSRLKRLEANTGQDAGLKEQLVELLTVARTGPGSMQPEAAT